MYDDFNIKFPDIKWARIIIDEVVSIRLPKNLDFKCNFIWFLTATPSGIRYIRRNYIKTLVNTMSDNLINSIIIKNNNDFVDQSMNLPNINQIIIKCLTPSTLNIVKEYVDSDIISMLNAGNFEDAITKLNCNVETSENILEVLTKKIKKDLYNKRNELEYEQKRIPDDKKTHDEKLKKINDKIESLNNQVISIEEKIKSFKEENCPICFEEFVSPLIVPCCNNLFCLPCLTLCKSNCPMCRQKFDLSQCTVIDDNCKKIKQDLNLTKADHVLCSKLNNLISLLKAKPKGKFLLFASYDKTFDNINKHLTENNIKHSRLVGSNVVINAIIRRFETNEVNVLMLNAQHYGSGLNLQMATDVIIYHGLSLELETQVIGRAQRLGRTEPLNVYYLLNDNEHVNCKNPTLNLDIFEDDKTMLDMYNGTSNIDEIDDINMSDEFDDLNNIKTINTKTKTKTKTNTNTNTNTKETKTKTKETKTKSKRIKKYMSPSSDEYEMQSSSDYHNLNNKSKTKTKINKVKTTKEPKIVKKSDITN
jgi:hypothetical protein